MLCSYRWLISELNLWPYANRVSVRSRTKQQKVERLELPPGFQQIRLNVLFSDAYESVFKTPGGNPVKVHHFTGAPLRGSQGGRWPPLKSWWPSHSLATPLAPLSRARIFSLVCIFNFYHIPLGPVEPPKHKNKRF